MNPNRVPIPLIPNPPFSPHTRRRDSDKSYSAGDYESDFPPIRVHKSTPDRVDSGMYPHVFPSHCFLTHHSLLILVGTQMSRISPPFGYASLQLHFGVPPPGRNHIDCDVPVTPDVTVTVLIPGSLGLDTGIL